MVASPRLRTIPTNPAVFSGRGVVKFFSPEDVASALGKIQVEHLVQELSEIEGVESANIVFPILGDNRSITFQIKLLNSLELDEDEVDCESKIEKSEQIFDLAQKQVLQTCRLLRNITNEKWYFRTQLVSNFDDRIADF